jgi:hypothetical protein
MKLDWRPRRQKVRTLVISTSMRSSSRLIRAAAAQLAA